MKHILRLNRATLIVLTLGICLGCKSQQSPSPEEPTKPELSISHGTYAAVVAQDNVDAELRAYNQTSKIGFSFEADQKFIYMVRAMGREIDDVGKWEVRGDSLFIFDLQRGPNSAFYIEEISADQYRISGPNVFTLTKVGDSSTPFKN